jgi:hypothetical protein
LKQFTIKEAAALIGVTPGYIYRVLKSDKLGLQKVSENDRKRNTLLDEDKVMQIKQLYSSANEGLSCAQASAILGISPKTLWLKAKNGEIPSYTVVQKGRPVYRFEPEVLHRFQQKLKSNEPEVLSTKNGEFLFQPWTSSDQNQTGRVVRIEQLSKGNFSVWLLTADGERGQITAFKEAGWKPLITLEDEHVRRYSNGTVTLRYPIPEHIHDYMYDHFVYLFVELGLRNIQLTYEEDSIVIETKKYTSTGKWEDLHVLLLEQAIVRGSGSISWHKENFTIEPDLEGYLANLTGKKRQIINEVIQNDQITKQELVEVGIELYLKKRHPDKYKQLDKLGLLKGNE